MTSKKSIGIQKIQREIDHFKFKIDELCENELPMLGASSPDRNAVFKRAFGLNEELNSLNKKLDIVSLNDQKIATPKFHEKKSVEKKRIQDLQKKLNNITSHLEPDEIEEDYFRILKSSKKTDIDDGKQSKSVSIKQQAEDEDVDDDDDDDVNDDDDDDDEESFEDDNVVDAKENVINEEEDDEVVYYVEALSDFVGEQPDDLSFKTGDRIEVTDASEDGWWTGRDTKGNTGLVPSTLVKILKPEEKMESFEKQPAGPPPLQKKRSGKELWEALKSDTSKTSVTDVLQAMKAVPSGFRTTTLGKWYQKEEYRSSAWVVPKTSPSNLQFKDLYWDSIDKKLKGHPVKLCRTFSLLSVRCIPPAGAGVQVLSRHVYIALWDKQKIISNIHLVRAIPLEKDMSWTFSPKIGRSIPSLYDGDILVRINQDDRNICLLFEMSCTYVRLSTGEKSEMSCGWASVPLFDAEGAPVGSKNFEAKINGGTPFEKGISLDATLSINPNQSLMQSLIRSNRQPRLLLKVTNYNKLTKDIYDMLPSTLITCQKYARFISLYRHHAAILLCRDDTINTGLLCDSIMTYFPRSLDFTDIMDALKQLWDEKNRINLTRSQRRNLGDLHKLFKQCFMESAFSLLECANLPPLIWADDQAEKRRNAFISSFIQSHNAMGGLLSADYQFLPLNINKLSFEVISKNSTEPAPITRDSGRMENGS